MSKKANVEYTDYAEEKAVDYADRYSQNVSSISRQLGITGIGASWLFLYQSGNNEYHLLWLLPLACFIIAILTDFYQYLLGASAFDKSILEGNRRKVENNKLKEIDNFYNIKKWFVFAGYALLLLLLLYKIFNSDRLLVTGNVIHSVTKKPLNANFICESLPDYKENANFATDINNHGALQFELTKRCNYNFQLRKEGFYDYTLRLNVDSAISTGNKTIYLEFQLRPLIKSSTISLNNIYFDYDSSTLRLTSNDQLDSIARILVENPTVKVEVRAFSDDRGSDDYNIKLSKRRALSVEHYLISQGVLSIQLSANGYGKIKPLNTGEISKQRDQNRRVELKIIGNYN